MNMYRATAAEQAKHLLHSASQKLYTADPATEVGPILDESLDFPLHDVAARRQSAFLPSFAETAAHTLAFVVGAGGHGVTPADRAESTTRAMQHVVRRNFGADALHWLERRVEPAAGSGRSLNWGGTFGSAFDRDGLVEAQATYEWGPSLMDALPAPLFRLARAAAEALPNLRPVFSTVRCARTSGTQQITFDIDFALALTNLKPLMDTLGLGHQHASLMSACAFILGARFTLPPATSTLTLRPMRSGVELRLDVNLDALPDVPPQLMSLLRLQMAERPRGLDALHRWLLALTPEGYDGPGGMAVLSVVVRPELPARVALYLRPVALEADSDGQAPPSGNGHATPDATPVAAASFGESYATPVWGPPPEERSPWHR